MAELLEAERYYRFIQSGVGSVESKPVVTLAEHSAASGLQLPSPTSIPTPIFVPVNIANTPPPAAMKLLHPDRMAVEWQEFHEHFKLWLSASGFSSEPSSRKRDMLLNLGGKPVREIYSTFGIENATYDEAVSRLDAYFKPRVNLHYEKWLLRSQKQDANEALDDYLIRIQRQADRCGYGERREEALLEAMMDGIHCGPLRDKLLRKGSTLTFQKAVEISRTFFAHKAQANEMINPKYPMHAFEAADTNAVAVRAPLSGQGRVGGTSVGRNLRMPVAARSHWGNQAAAEGFGNSSANQGSGCTFCGRHHVRGNCPAYQQKCNNCGKLGHFSAKCSQQRNQMPAAAINYDQVHHNVENRRDVDRDLVANLATGNNWFFGQVDGDEPRRLWHVRGKLCNKLFFWLVDSGSVGNIISSYTYSILECPPVLQQTDLVLTAVGGQTLPVLGFFHAPISIKVGTLGVIARFLVVNLPAGQRDTKIMGLDLACALGLIQIPRNPVFGLDQRSSSAPFVKAFPDVFEGVGLIKDFVVDFDVDSTVSPAVCGATKVPFQLLPKYKETLATMEAGGVIRRNDKPSRWVNRVQLVVKKDGSLRPCLDPKQLNRALNRPRTHIPTVSEMVVKIRDRHGRMPRFFAKLDCRAGFWQCKLSEQAQEYTTFATPWGRYCFCRLPFGLSLAPEVFHRVVAEKFSGIDGLVTYFDDILVSSFTIDGLNQLIQKTLTRAREIGLTFNLEKCVFCTSEVVYLGHVISQHGVKVDPSKVTAIQNMRRPYDLSEVRRFLGVLGFVRSHLGGEVAEIASPLRDLAKKGRHFEWGPEQQESFDRLKQLMSNAPTLVVFDPSAPCTIVSDASNAAIGGVLLQDQQPVAYFSRSLTDTEKNWAIIEKETLALVCTIEHFRQYLFGAAFKCVTDHRSLITILKKSDPPARIARLLLRLQHYTLELSYASGSSSLLSIPDLLSRSVRRDQVQEPGVSDEAVSVFATAFALHVSMSNEKRAEYRREFTSDPVMIALTNTINDGWPDTKAQCPADLREFFEARYDIQCIDGLLLMGSRLVTPSKYREDVLGKLHGSHSGLRGMNELARSHCWWPSLRTDIATFVANCTDCCATKPQRLEPLKPHLLPEGPWDVVCSDVLTHDGHHYVVVIDRYTKWIEAQRLTSLSCAATASFFRKLFQRLGFPVQLFSDNGTNFTGPEMRQLAEEGQFVLQTSSPIHSRGNGQAERAVAIIKNLLLRDGNLDGLLAQRNVPHVTTGFAPSVLMYGRLMRIGLPTADDNVHNLWVSRDTVAANFDKATQRQSCDFDRRHAAKVLPELLPGDHVLFKKLPTDSTRTAGTVVSCDPLYIATDSGRYRRNRADVWKLHLDDRRDIFEEEEV
jgi:transposase InsO family protein